MMAAETTTRWRQALTELETGLEAFERALEAGEVPEVARWEPATDLGPLPAALAQRATSLSWRMTAAEQRARDRRDALQGELDDLGRRRGAGAAYAASGAPPAPGAQEVV